MKDKSAKLDRGSKNNDRFKMSKKDLYRFHISAVKECGIEHG